MSTNPNKCVWCGSFDVVEFLTPISVYGERAYSFARCRVCAIKYALPFDTSGIDYGAIQTTHVAYAHLRAENEWIHSMLNNGSEPYWAQQVTEHLCFSWVDTRLRHILKYCLRAAREKQTLRILEVGCNLGYLGAVLRRFGHEYVGLDIQEDAIARAREYYGDHFICETVEEYAKYDQHRFDLVIATEVIEHVTDPRTFLNACISLLYTKGVLILTTPNGDRAMPSEWSSDLPPIHLTIFSRSSFELLESSSLRVRCVTDSGVSYAMAWLRAHIKQAKTGLSRMLAGERGEKSIPILDPFSQNFHYRPGFQILNPSLSPFLYWKRLVLGHSLAVITAGVSAREALVVELQKEN